MMSNKNTFKCPNCPRQFLSQRSLRLHLPSCRKSHLLTADAHSQIEYHPLRSLRHFDDQDLDGCSQCVDADIDDDDSEMDNVFTAESFVCSDDYENADHFHNDYEEGQGQQTTAAAKLQVRLNHLINSHKAPVKLYDDIIQLFNDYISSNNFNKYTRLKCRKAFIKSSEAAYNVSHLRPKYRNVILTDKSEVTVPVFDAKYMILDLVTNPLTMNESNIAGGYDVFTGNVDHTFPDNQCYGEVHTGDQWIQAKNRYCTNTDEMDNEMPIALIVFGDKSHTDLHGTLSVTPLTFTLTCFNRAARNNNDFWRPLGYIPNLSYGKNKADKRETKDKIQDEHRCLSAALDSVKEIHRNGGFYATVMGRVVKIKVWIHYFIGDTEGNNKFLGHFAGNKKQVCRPYRDCHCNFNDLMNPNPSCVYTTVNEMREAKRAKRENLQEGLALLKSMSRYDIKNALTCKDLPLSDNERGPWGMTPPELMHTSGQGLIKYIFESLSIQIGSGRDRDEIDKQHIRMYMIIKRQSERDFPRGAMRNGIIDGTKCQAEERKGNLFLLMCIAHTLDGSIKIQKALDYPSQGRWKKFLEFFKLYLSMEEWFHDCNPKEEVHNSREMIAKVLRMLQDLFPREEGTNGWCIPKMHAMTKFMEYMIRYGSAMNFFGGQGESSHKFFVKAPGLKTQRRAKEFATQIAEQYYQVMVTQYALRSIQQQDERNNVLRNNTENQMDDISVSFSGKYYLVVTNDILQGMRDGDRVYVKWHSDRSGIRQNDKNYCLHKHLVTFILRKLDSMDASVFENGYSLEGYTRITTRSGDGCKLLLYAHPSFQGIEWYDWVYVHFEEINATGDTVENFYPAKILGFVTINNVTEAVIHCAEKPFNWSEVEEKFIVRTKLGSTLSVSIVSVPISSLVHPLCALPDYGNDSLSYIIVLPKRNWSRYFGDKI